MSTAWGQAYTYDGFGNLTAKTVTQGSATNLSQAYDPATNHAIGGSYDANGNTYSVYNGTNSIGYDAENRMSPTCTGCGLLSYDPAGKRLAVVNPTAAMWTLYFYDIFGQRILTVPYGASATASLYFGSKLVISDGVAVITDRLGSVRANSNNETFSYFPYGDERTSTADYRVKFGTYFRDGNWDYADQRYYYSGAGRFNTADPAGAKAVDLTNPVTWNKYIYVNGDPVNVGDPTGLCDDDGLVNCQEGYSSAVDLGLEFGSPVLYITGIDPNDPLASALISSVNSGTQIPTAGVPVFSTDSQPAFTSPIQLVASGVTQGAGPLTDPATWAAITTLSIVGGTDIAVSLAGTSMIDVTSLTGPADVGPGAAVPGPSFIGQTNGPPVPVPNGATGPTPAWNGRGFVFDGGAGGNGLAGNVSGVRIMDPTVQNPTGYVNYGAVQTNGGWQSVNPYSGQSIGPGNPWWHIPLGPQQ